MISAIAIVFQELHNLFNIFIIIHAFVHNVCRCISSARQSIYQCHYYWCISFTISTITFCDRLFIIIIVIYAFLNDLYCSLSRTSLSVIFINFCKFKSMTSTNLIKYILADKMLSRWITFFNRIVMSTNSSQHIAR